MSSSPPSTRHIAIDLARVGAILFMIQGHTLDVLLSPELRQGFVFDKWLLLRGLTAPTFFMLSGVSFFLATSRRWDSYLTWSPVLFKRLRRFAFFIVLGYFMHFPVRSLGDFRWLDANGWEGWFQVDVLQCIGLTLTGLQVLVLLAKTPERFAKIALGAAATVVLLTPITWHVGFNFAPHALSAYLNGLTGSLFPLFPWSAYVLFGVAVGYYCRTRQTSTGSLPLGHLATGGLCLIAGGAVLQRIPISLYGSLDYWHTSPNLFLARVGWVCLLVSGLAFLAKRVRLPENAIRSLAQESLLIYFIHVAILYGSLWNPGLRQLIGSTLGLPSTMAWIAAMLIVMVLLAWGWNWTKKNAPGRTLAVRAAIVLVAAYSLA
jgi:uncharacterized membrane protein